VDYDFGIPVPELKPGNTALCCQSISLYALSTLRVPSNYQFSMVDVISVPYPESRNEPVWMMDQEDVFEA
jgi:hypothetical protein